MAEILVLVKERTGPGLWSAVAGGNFDYVSEDYATILQAVQAALHWAREVRRPEDWILIALDWDNAQSSAEWIQLHRE